MRLYFFLLTFVLMTATACTSPTAPIDADEPDSAAFASDSIFAAKGGSSAFGNMKGEAATSCNEANFRPYTYTLWAGQSHEAGLVTISTDGQNLNVTYDTNETADLSEVHVNVYTNADSVPTKRPAPGRAPYKASSLNADTHTVTIPLSDLGVSDSSLCSTTFYVIAHAALTVDATGNTANAGETAYSGGIKTPGKGAWFYVSEYGNFCDCVSAECSVTGDLLAGQYQDIGTMTITEDGDDLLVTYDLDWINPSTGELYPLGELAIYVFTDPADLSGNRPVPGKAPYKVSLEELAGATTWTVRIPKSDFGNTDTFYVVAKTTVNGETTYGGLLNETGINVGGARAWWYYLTFVSCD